MEQTSLSSHFTWLNLFTYINGEKQVLISCIPPARRAGWFSIKIPWRISLSKVPVLTKREYQSTHAFDSNFWSKCSSAVAFQVRSGVWAERRCSWRCTQCWTEKARADWQQPWLRRSHWLTDGSTWPFARFLHAFKYEKEVAASVPSCTKPFCSINSKSN